MKLLNYEDCKLAEAMVLIILINEEANLLGDNVHLFDSLGAKLG